MNELMTLKDFNFSQYNSVRFQQQTINIGCDEYDVHR